MRTGNRSVVESNENLLRSKRSVLLVFLSHLFFFGLLLNLLRWRDIRAHLDELRAARSSFCDRVRPMKAKPASAWVELGQGQRICLDAVLKATDLLQSPARASQDPPRSWLGAPLSTPPADILDIAQVIAKVQPDVVLHLSRGSPGEALFIASTLKLLGGPCGRVVHIAQRNVSASHPAATRHDLWKERITSLSGPSTNPLIVAQVEILLRAWLAQSVLIVDDSSPRYLDVLAHLRIFRRFLSPGSYYIALGGERLQRRFVEEQCGIANIYKKATLAECRTPRFGPPDAIRDFIAEEAAAGRSYIEDKAAGSILGDASYLKSTESFM